VSSKKQGKSYPRDIGGLRDALFDEIEDIRDGVSSPHEAVAFCSLAETVLNTYECELKARAFQISMQERELRLEENKLKIQERRIGLDRIEGGDDYENQDEENVRLVLSPH